MSREPKNPRKNGFLKILGWCSQPKARLRVAKGDSPLWCPCPMWSVMSAEFVIIRQGWMLQRKQEVLKKRGSGRMEPSNAFGGRRVQSKQGSICKWILGFLCNHSEENGFQKAWEIQVYLWIRLIWLIPCQMKAEKTHPLIPVPDVGFCSPYDLFYPSLAVLHLTLVSSTLAISVCLTLLHRY